MSLPKYALSSFIEFIKGKREVDMFSVYFFPSFTSAEDCDPEHTMICQPIKSWQWTTEHLTLCHCNQLVDVNTDMLPGLCLAGDCWRAGAEKVGSPHSRAELSHWCADTGDQP